MIVLLIVVVPSSLKELECHCFGYSISSTMTYSSITNIKLISDDKLKCRVFPLTLHSNVKEISLKNIILNSFPFHLQSLQLATLQKN